MNLKLFSHMYSAITDSNANVHRKQRWDSLHWQQPHTEDAIAAPQ